jgi:glycosyltransferase involved in cell wall biosynthesis
LLEFEQRLKQPGISEIIQHVGFVSGEQKEKLLQDSDLLCFPTYYQNENQPVNLIEAMAFGLPIITTRWRSLPEIFPPGYPGLVEVRSPEQIANAMLGLLTMDTAETFRNLFLQHFTLERYLSALAQAFTSNGSTP